jgi:hypothetical protein
VGAPICYAAKDILRLRVTRLASTGAPDAGAGNGYVSDATVQVERTPRVEAGEQHIQRNGAAVICQQAQECDTLVGQDLTLQLCTNDLILIGLLTGAVTPSDATGVMGYLERGMNDGCQRPVCVEWWSYAWDNNAQAMIAGAPQYWHRVVPYVTWVHAPSTYARGFQVVTLNGKGSENPNITTNGPYDDWPTQIATADGLVNRSFGEWREATLPAAACATITVSSAAS